MRVDVMRIGAVRLRRWGAVPLVWLGSCSRSGSSEPALAFAPTIGATAVAFKRDGQADPSVSTPPLLTAAGGSTLIACVGRGVIAAHAAPTDNKGNRFVQIGTTRTYTRWPTSGTACYAATDARGGAGHVITAPVSPSAPFDETTLAVVEVQNATRVQDVSWNESLTSPGAAREVTTSGPATLVTFWWGDAGATVNHVASAQPGFQPLQAVLQSGALVQTAVAAANVDRAGSYTVTWASNQGAQLWLIGVGK
jgi:hypothetical protein